MKLLSKAYKLSQIAVRIARWHSEYYVRKSGFPLVCGIFLTNRCNLCCQMCSIWRDQRKSTLTASQVEHMIDSIGSGLCYISFSGGEPLLVPDLPRMIRYAAQRIPYVHMVSNGLLLDRAAATELSGAGLTEISISLDGEREWHNTNRGSPQSYDAAVAAIVALREVAPGIKIVVNSVLYPDKPDQIEAVVKITRELGVGLKIQPVNKHFAFAATSGNPPSIEYSDRFRKDIDSLISYLRKEPHVVNSASYLRRIPAFFEGTLRCPMIQHGCRLPLFYAEISAYGTVSPCLYASGWDGTCTIEQYAANRKAPDLQKAITDFELCRKCDSTMYICYWEPMVYLPVTNFLRFALVERFT